jgi:hypothetical protein
MSEVLLEALERGKTVAKEILAAEGGALTAEQLEELHVLPAEVFHALRRGRKLLGVTVVNDEKQEVRYPVWQFRTGWETLEGFEKVLRMLDPTDDWSAMLFFLEPNERLEPRNGEHLTPLEALKEGKVAEVVLAALAWTSRGA